MSRGAEAHVRTDSERSVDARDFLLDEAHHAIDAQMRFLSSQDVRVVATFTISLLLVSATGIVGDIRLSGGLVSVLTLSALAVSVVVWLCCWASYYTRKVAFSVEIDILARSYRDASTDEMQDASLEALVAGFEQNSETIPSQRKWLQYAIVGLGIQLALLAATTIAGAPTGAALGS